MHDALRQWLDKMNAKHLAHYPRKEGQGATVDLYNINGHVAVVLHYPREGWDIFVPAVDSNQIDETFAAAERKLGVKTDEHYERQLAEAANSAYRWCIDDDITIRVPKDIPSVLLALDEEPHALTIAVAEVLSDQLDKAARAAVRVRKALEAEKAAKTKAG